MSLRKRTSHCCALWMFLGPFAFLLLAAVMAQRVADPFSLYHRADYIPTHNAPARGELTSYSYLAKAKRIVVEKPSRLVLGTSVIDHGFRLPGSLAQWYAPSVEQRKTLYDAGGKDTALYYNAAIRGAGMKEARDYLKHAYANNPKLTHVALGIEYSMMTPLVGHTPQVPFMEQTSVPFAFTMEYMFSPLAMKSAWMLVRGRWDMLEAYGLGAYARLQGLVDSMWTRVRPTRTEQAIVVATPVETLPTPQGNAEMRNPDDMQKFAFAVWFAANLRGAYNHNGKDATVYPETLGYLKEIVAFCKERGITLTVFINPQAPLFWAAMEAAGLAEQQAYWLQQVTGVTPVLDFADSIDFAAAGDTMFHTDTLHFDQAGGELIMPSLTGAQARAKPVLVTHAKVSETVQRRARLLAEWKRTHPMFTASIAALPMQVMAKDMAFLTSTPPQLTPVAYAGEIHGYKVVKTLGYYYAVPASMRAPYALDALLDLKHAETLEKLRAALK